jgi:MFS transporter, DHA1 family, multidrug resistance protein
VTSIQPPPAGTPDRSYRLALILGALTAMGPLAIDMYLPALPTIARDLGAAEASVQVSLAVYFAGIAIGQIFYGPASDRFGRKPSLYVGLALFIVSCVGCAFVQRVETLIALRFVQALGGCAPLVIPRAVVRDCFDERGSVRMLSMLTLVMGLAPILAPSIGGQLLVTFGWRAIFWVLAGYGAVWCAAVALFLPESLPAGSRVRRPIGAILATYLALLRDRAYLGYVLTGGFVFAGLLTYISGSPFVFIEVFGVAPERYGLYFGSNAVGLITASQINRYWAARAGPRHVIALVLPLAVVAGTALVVNAWTGFGGFVGILVPLFCFIACHGFTFPNTTALAMAPHGRVAGSASALLGTVQFLLGAMAGTLVGALGNGTPVPFAAIIAVCAISALTASLTLTRR